MPGFMMRAVPIDATVDEEVRFARPSPSWPRPKAATKTVELPAIASPLAIVHKPPITSPGLQKFGQGDHAVIAVIADAVPIRAQYAV